METKKDEVQKIEKVFRDNKLEIRSIGIGELRAVGSWILVMLASEDSSMRPKIILEVMERLGISIEDLSAVYNDSMCSHCGISLLAHARDAQDRKICP